MNVLGMWMWPQSVRIHGAEKVIDHCARAKVTDVYFLTKGLGGTTAYRSKFAPCDGDRDLLRELLDAAHARGVRVHAWFTSASDEHYKQLHPESGRCHFTRGKDKGLIALADAGYLSYMEKITQELIRTYEIDGLHLDYIRYNHLLYGWSEEDLSRYAAAGADVAHLKQMMHRMFDNTAEKDEQCLFNAYRNGDESALALARTRRKDVMHFASTLAQAARAENSGLILSAALMPEGAYEDVAFSDLHYGQNYEDAAAIYDFVLPMAYSKAYDQDGQWVKRVAEGSIKRGLKTIVGLHAYEGGTGLSLQEDIAALKDTPVHGVCLFREGATVLAYACEREVCVYNPLPEAISRIIACAGKDTFEIAETIMPGEEKCFTFPFEPGTARVFSENAECSVYLTKE